MLGVHLTVSLFRMRAITMDTFNLVQRVLDGVERLRDGLYGSLQVGCVDKDRTGPGAGCSFMQRQAIYMYEVLEYPLAASNSCCRALPHRTKTACVGC